MNSAPRPAGRRGYRDAPRRVGFGTVFTLAAVVLIALWVGRNPGAVRVVSPPQPTAVVRTAETPIVITGVGNKATDPFYLAGGTYHGDWAAWGEAAEFPPCTHSTELLAVDPAGTDATGAVVANLANKVDVPATGASYGRDLSDLKPGRYYLDVRSACSWQVSLTPKQ